MAFPTFAENLAVAQRIGRDKSKKNKSTTDLGIEALISAFGSLGKERTPVETFTSTLAGSKVTPIEGGPVETGGSILDQLGRKFAGSPGLPQTGVPLTQKQGASFEIQKQLQQARTDAKGTTAKEFEKFKDVEITESLAKTTNFKLKSIHPFFEVDDAMKRTRKLLGQTNSLANVELGSLKALLGHLDKKEQLIALTPGEESDRKDILEAIKSKSPAFLEQRKNKEAKFQKALAQFETIVDEDKPEAKRRILNDFPEKKEKMDLLFPDPAPAPKPNILQQFGKGLEATKQGVRKGVDFFGDVFSGDRVR